MGQDVFNILANKRIYAHIPEGEKWQGNLYATWNVPSEQQEANKKTMREIADKVSAEDFRKSLTNKVLDMIGIEVGSEKTAWGQFQARVPRKFYY